MTTPPPPPPPVSALTDEEQIERLHNKLEQIDSRLTKNRRTRIIFFLFSLATRIDWPTVFEWARDGAGFLLGAVPMDEASPDDTGTYSPAPSPLDLTAALLEDPELSELWNEVGSKEESRDLAESIATAFLKQSTSVTP